MTAPTDPVAVVERVADECDVDVELLNRVAALLNDFPANGKPQDRDAASAAIILGFIAQHETKKHCPTCGTERPDCSYVKPTTAGRLFAAAIRALSTQPANSTDEGLAALLREALVIVEKIAISHSNYGHVEGNRRAYAISRDVRQRIEAIDRGQGT